MSRKSAFPYETEKRPFATNLRVLMKENGTTQRELGEAIGVRPQTISLYCVGQSLPDVEGMAKICKYFNVSSDWLIGVTDVRNADITARAACEYTGLTEEAVEALHKTLELKEKNSSLYGSCLEILSHFIQTHSVNYFCLALDTSTKSLMAATDKVQELLDSKKDLYINALDCVDDLMKDYRLYRFEAIDEIMQFVRIEQEPYKDSYSSLTSNFKRGEINGEQKERNE